MRITPHPVAYWAVLRGNIHLKRRATANIRLTIIKISVAHSYQLGTHSYKSMARNWMSHMNSRHNSVGRRNRTNEIVPLSSITARITLLDGSITGLREINSFGSILQVRAAPFAELDKMKTAITGSFIAYVIDAPRVYTGHGRDSRNVGDRIDKTARQTS